MKSNRLTSQKLANAFPRSKLDERRVSQICVKAGVMNLKGEGYEFLPAVDAIIAHYKTSYESHGEQSKEDRQRKTKAEADSAELDALGKFGELVLRKHVEIIYAEARVEIRKLIERAKLSADVRTKLCRDIAAIKLSKGEPES